MDPTTPKSLRSRRRTPNTPRASGDRFIHGHRSQMDLSISQYNLSQENVHMNQMQKGKRMLSNSCSGDLSSGMGAGEEVPDSPSRSNTAAHTSCNPIRENYKNNLAESMFDGKQPTSKVLAFKAKAPAPKSFQNHNRVLYSSCAAGSSSKKQKSYRYIPQKELHTLDLPNLVDDYYLNLLDWNKSNLLAIGLGAEVYLWNAGTGETTQLCSMPEDSIVTSVSWIKNGNCLAVGNADAEVQLWDVSAQKQMRNMKGHQARVGSLAWNNYILSSGSRDSMIFNHDVRQEKHIVGRLRAHTQEVCGLQWSHNGKQLASGGNDNTLNIWNYGETTPVHTMNHHNAAVKAVAWCPWQSGLLATGGGTADRCIKFWNTNTGALLNSVDTHSQVCALQWSRHQRELVSSHGFSQNQLTVWKYPTMVRIAELKGHTARVLHMAQSPDGTVIASIAGDETLALWKVFDLPAKQKSTTRVRSSRNKVKMNSMRIR